MKGLSGVLDVCWTRFTFQGSCTYIVRNVLLESVTKIGRKVVSVVGGFGVLLKFN